MADEDLASVLPEPPPPRAARRDAAIEAAMLRFDGGDPAATAPAPRVGRTASRWSLLGRPQVGALLTAALVGVIAVPVWVANRDEFVPVRQSAPPASPSAAPGARTPTRPPSGLASPRPRPAGPAPTTASPVEPPPPPSKRSGVPAQREAFGELAGTAAEPLPAPAPAPPPPPPPPPPPVAAPMPAPAQAAKMARAEEAVADDERDAVVVTGFRASARGRSVSRRAGAAEIVDSGAWNACTVRDPARDLAACKKLVDPAARGDKGRAAAQVADGLSAAWRGDDDAAIAAFGRAIDQSPRLAFAWLNRGLARERKGDVGGALADIDKAVRLAPNVARGYYQRSLFLNRQGQTRRARDDWERAVKLDPRLDADDE